MSLADSILSGDRLALSRLLSKIEDDTEEGQKALGELFQHTGQAHLIGVTGAPGTGKSTLVNQLVRSLRNLPDGAVTGKVAIIAVDPSSPFSGGAIMGDRIRMRDLAGDPGVFIRSMASRGALGGLAHATAGLVQAFDAAGYDMIFIETVGAGQVEVDIARLAHTTLVVEAPGLGDDIQAIKAGIMEIADILVVNKADRPGVNQTVRALKNMLDLAHPAPRIFQDHGPYRDSPSSAMGCNLKTEEDTIANRSKATEGTSPVHDTEWIPPVHRTIATDGTGIEVLMTLIKAHKHHLNRSGEWDRRDRARLKSALYDLLKDALMERWRMMVPPAYYREVVDNLVHRRISPYDAVNLLLTKRIDT